jgi:GTP-binding protein LepA
MNIDRIRNFSIIAHIDHGKSTLADRLLEVTHTIDKRKMRDQVLDNMELERERGITIKMQPVRMMHGEYELHLIDTPGHIDFSYEVSRALKAVEGCILLVDATQGVQAQTLKTLEMAKSEGLVIIPVLSKIDSPLARVDEISIEVAEMLNIDIDDILHVSGKTGEGVDSLLETIIKKIPSPKSTKTNLQQGLVFDFQYSNHRGIIVYLRVTEGIFRKGDELQFAFSREKFVVSEVGTFTPLETETGILSNGEIGYLVTGIKKPGIASVGDTVISQKNPAPGIPGYLRPTPVVWASIYTESQDDFPELKLALSRLQLSDSSFTYEEETSGTLGRGFRCGFLGMLHLEIISERLRREFGLELIITTPTITYHVTLKNNSAKPGDGPEIITVYTPFLFPNDGLTLEVYEPWAEATIILPTDFVSVLMPMLYDHEAEIMETFSFSDNRSKVVLLLPLRELMRNFFDELKSVTSGYASISYELIDERKAEVTRLDIIVADEVIPAFSRVVSKRRVQEEAEKAVEKLAKVLPRQQFAMKVQGYGLGRILSSHSISAFRKDVTQHMYGGDITRKMKLREKQKEGKKRMRQTGKVNISQDVFIKMMKGD